MQAAQTTRELIDRFVDAWFAGDTPTVRSLLADDACWQPPLSVGQTLMGPEAIASGLTGGAAGSFVKLETLQRIAKHIIVDRNHAMVLVQLAAIAHSGARYVNEYAWHYEISDGLIHRIEEYADTLRAARLGFLPLQEQS